MLQKWYNMLTTESLKVPYETIYNWNKKTKYNINKISVVITLQGVKEHPFSVSTDK